jgi:hypothetical protein
MKKQRKKIEVQCDKGKFVINGNIKIVYGRDILKPIESIPPVSQTIEKYIKSRFATNN